MDVNGDETTPALDSGVPEMDGQGYEVIPAPELEAERADIEMVTEEKTVGEEQGIQADEARLAFPPKSPTLPEADVDPQPIKEDTQEVEEKTETKKENRGWALLPEISRLAKEMVKNGEEKVAVAQGAYNSVRPPNHMYIQGKTDDRLTDISEPLIPHYQHKKLQSSLDFDLQHYLLQQLRMVWKMGIQAHWPISRKARWGLVEVGSDGKDEVREVGGVVEAEAVRGVEERLESVTRLCLLKASLFLPRSLMLIRTFASRLIE